MNILEGLISVQAQMIDDESFSHDLKVHLVVSQLP